MAEERSTRCGSEVDSAILEEVARTGPCTFDDLVRALPEYTWNQVFSAVDRLSRTGNVTLRHPTLFEYVVSAGPNHYAATGKADGF